LVNPQPNSVGSIVAGNWEQALRTIFTGAGEALPNTITDVEIDGMFGWGLSPKLKVSDLPSIA
jgi:hypothetical protein